MELLCFVLFLVAIWIWDKIDRARTSDAKEKRKYIERGGFPVLCTRLCPGGPLKEIGETVTAANLKRNKLYVLKRSLQIEDGDRKLMARTIIMYDGKGKGGYHVFKWYDEWEDKDETFTPSPHIIWNHDEDNTFELDPLYGEPEPYTSHQPEYMYIRSFGLTAEEVEEKVVDVGLKYKRTKGESDSSIFIQAGEKGLYLYDVYFDEERDTYRIKKIG